LPARTLSQGPSATAAVPVPGALAGAARAGSGLLSSSPATFGEGSLPGAGRRATSTAAAPGTPNPPAHAAAVGPAAPAVAWVPRRADRIVTATGGVLRLHQWTPAATRVLAVCSDYATAYKVRTHNHIHIHTRTSSKYACTHTHTYIHTYTQRVGMHVYTQTCTHGACAASLSA
jgi:hypothetical protein